MIKQGIEKKLWQFKSQSDEAVAKQANRPAKPKTPEEK
jgi:hypothetical protein